MIRPEEQVVEPHPSVDELSLYRAGELSAQRETQVRYHLAECRECAEEILDQAALDDLDDAPMLDDIELEAAWRRQRRRLLPEDESRVPPSRMHRRRFGAIAASLAVAVLGVWLGLMQMKLASLRAPEVNPPRVSLDPIGSIRQSVERIEVLEVGKEAKRCLLVLNPSRRLEEARHRVELRSEDGRVLWSVEVVPNEAGAVVLLLDRGQVPPGKHQLVLSARTGAGETVADKFVIRIRWL